MRLQPESQFEMGSEERPLFVYIGLLSLVFEGEVGLSCGIVCTYNFVPNLIHISKEFIGHLLST